MNDKFFRVSVIAVDNGSWFIKQDENGEIELTGDLLNAKFFYGDKSALKFKEKCNEIHGVLTVFRFDIEAKFLHIVDKAD